MSKCTAAQAVAAMKYWLGYYEKASSSYATTRDKSAFTKNSGSSNYTYPGYLCGVQGQPWCAATVTTAIYEACGSSKSDAKSVMYGVWPYVACNQIWDAAPSSAKFWSYYQRWTKGKGDRKTYYPQAGDIIVFTDNGSNRSHTGMVYAADKTYVYTIEGNSGNMCRKRSYKLTSSYIYGWIRPNYATSSATADDTEVEQYGKSLSVTLHQLSKGTAGPEVETLQLLLNRKAEQGVFELAEALKVDGDFGATTEAAVKAYKDAVWPDYAPNNGKVGVETWGKLIG